MSEEKRLHRKELRLRPQMIDWAHELGLIDDAKYFELKKKSNDTKNSEYIVSYNLRKTT
tara:strand:- start:541 stop:717 length:177 start_codon:yes stop_codon:yes gene_type:complete